MNIPEFRCKVNGELDLSMLCWFQSFRCTSMHALIRIPFEFLVKLGLKLELPAYQWKIIMAASEWQNSERITTLTEDNCCKFDIGGSFYNKLNHKIFLSCTSSSRGVLKWAYLYIRKKNNSNTNDNKETYSAP